MINIVICEDQTAMQKHMELIIDEYIKEIDIKAEVTLITDEPKKVIDFAQAKKHQTNVYFLDISLNKEMNGLILAKKIREIDNLGYLIFVTAHAELTLKTFQYKLKALDYICKDDLDVKTRVHQCLDVIKQENEKVADRVKDTKISIKSGSYIYNISLNRIVYVETSINHKLTLHTFDKSIEFYGSLSILQEELGENFIRTHRSYVVNQSHIKEVSLKNGDTYVLMKDGSKCSLSKKYIKGVVKNVKYFG